MASSVPPIAGHQGETIRQPINGEDRSAAPSKRNRGAKANNASMTVDFSADDNLLADLKAFAQVMKVDLNKYIIEAVETKFKADRERVRKEFASKK